MVAEYDYQCVVVKTKYFESCRILIPLYGSYKKIGL